MSESVNIKRGDLHLALSAAFTRGRYVLMTAGDGQPVEITIDLRERPDDLFDAEPDFVTLDAATDDHGPAIPAQSVRQNPQPPTGPRVYEFALQDVFTDGYFGLEQVGRNDAPDQAAAAAADWVHVYDRVTRERRTLKRPAPGPIEAGLRDVAAELRRGFSPEDATHIESSAPLPPVGPLTSKEGLRAGDVLTLGFSQAPSVVRFVEVIPAGQAYGGEIRVEFEGGSPGINGAHHFSFVGRPDADGWMTWAGGENPVPGARVEWRNREGSAAECPADELAGWSHPYGPNGCWDVIAFRIVDSKGGTTDT